MPTSASDAARKYPVVFIGVVESRNAELVRFSVRENFGTELKQLVEMNQSGSTCEFKFQPGKTYLIYTKADAKGLLVAANACSRTAELSAADADVRYLRSKTRVSSHKHLSL